MAQPILSRDILVKQGIALCQSGKQAVIRRVSARLDGIIAKIINILAQGKKGCDLNIIKFKNVISSEDCKIGIEIVSHQKQCSSRFYNILDRIVDYDDQVIINTLATVFKLEYEVCHCDEEYDDNEYNTASKEILYSGINVCPFEKLEKPQFFFRNCDILCKIPTYDDILKRSEDVANKEALHIIRKFEKEFVKYVSEGRSYISYEIPFSDPITIEKNIPRTYEIVKQQLTDAKFTVDIIKNDLQIYEGVCISTVLTDNESSELQAQDNINTDNSINSKIRKNNRKTKKN